MEAPTRFWVVKVVQPDGTTAFVYDRRDGCIFVPKYTTKVKAMRRNTWAFTKWKHGMYVLKRAKRASIEAFESEMNERHTTKRAKVMRKREEEVAKDAAARLRNNSRRTRDTKGFR